MVIRAELCIGLLLLVNLVSTRMDGSCIRKQTRLG